MPEASPRRAAETEVIRRSENKWRDCECSGTVLSAG